MNLLLDTHIWLWSNSSPDRLGRRVRRMIEQGIQDLWLSPMSLWEVSMLTARGRLRLCRPVEAWLAEALQSLPVKEAPVTYEVVLAQRDVVLPHADPVDRLLAATARVLDCALVTADERLLDGKGFRTIANR